MLGGSGRDREEGERGGRRLSDTGKIFLYSLTQVHVTKSGSALRAGISQEATDHQNVPLWLVCPGQVQDEAERLLPVLRQYRFHTALPTVPHALEAGVATWAA